MTHNRPGRVCAILAMALLSGCDCDPCPSGEYLANDPTFVPAEDLGLCLPRREHGAGCADDSMCLDGMVCNAHLCRFPSEVPT